MPDGGTVSDPADLIREADELIAKYGGSTPYLVRRLRDALEASREDRRNLDHAGNTVIEMMAKEWQKTEDERDDARAELRDVCVARAGVIEELQSTRVALAEANTTIARVKALADSMAATGSITPRAYAVEIRRALKGEQP